MAAHLPAWSQFTTRQDLADWRTEMSARFAELESCLFRWMVGIFVTFTALPGGWGTVLTVQLGLLA